ncbi:hypothetical protein M011DRAFT_481948 [Sporormia fimetaria CBS 119925]|uniref:Uncharacterized protein n=1 Tax=Sporormia fimetaria CBS 119925 TaxID=1340428 RepID=A0A6A6UXB0_9PLEO|nr:hypothetical protein M011DRAFT_481948 [Sporormia fimetaria CBS 119925]
MPKVASTPPKSSKSITVYHFDERVNVTVTRDDTPEAILRRICQSLVQNPVRFSWWTSVVNMNGSKAPLWFSALVHNKEYRLVGKSGRACRKKRRIKRGLEDSMAAWGIEDEKDILPDDVPHTRTQAWSKQFVEPLCDLGLKEGLNRGEAVGYIKMEMEKRFEAAHSRSGDMVTVEDINTALKLSREAGRKINLETLKEEIEQMQEEAGVEDEETEVRSGGHVVQVLPIPFHPKTPTGFDGGTGENA